MVGVHKAETLQKIQTIVGDTMAEVPVFVPALSSVEKAKDCMKTMYLISKLGEGKTKKYPNSLRLRIL